LRAFSHDLPLNADFRFPKDDHAQEHEPERRIALVPVRSVLKHSRPAAIRPLGGGKMPLTTERMDAIRNSKTMAGSPDADRIFDQHPAILRWSFCFVASFFREPMKENPHVQ